MRWSSFSIGRTLRVIMLFFVCMLFVACVSPLSNPVLPSDIIDADEYVMIEGLDLPVSERLGCGKQVCVGMMNYYGKEPGENILEMLEKLNSGSTPLHLLLVLRSSGIPVSVETGNIDSLFDNVSERIPTIVMLEVSPKCETPILRHLYRFSEKTIRGDHADVAHWVIISGYSQDGDKILLAAPRGIQFVVDRDLFERRWERYGRVTISDMELVRSQKHPQLIPP